MSADICLTFIFAKFAQQARRPLEGLWGKGCVLRQRPVSDQIHHLRSDTVPKPPFRNSRTRTRVPSSCPFAYTFLPEAEVEISELSVMGARLEVITGALRGETFHLTDEFSLGQHASNTVSIPDPSIAERHCLIRKEVGQFRLLALTGGGVLVNGTPVESHILQHGDQIHIGEAGFLVVLSDDQLSDNLPSVDHSDSLRVRDQRLRAASTLILQRREILALEANSTLPTMTGWNSLLQICRTIGSICDLEELEKRVLALIAEVVPAERGAMLLTGDRGEFLAVTGWDLRSRVEREVEVSRQVIDQVLRDGVAVLSNDLAGTGTISGNGEAGSQVRALLAVPLEVFDRVRGVIYLDTCDAAARFNLDQLRLLAAIGTVAALGLESARRVHWLEAENRRLQAEVNIEHDMVGSSACIREVHKFIAKVGPIDSTVLIHGESGTGKELVARAIHRNSPRSAKSFVAINCAALPESLLESELFGYEKGAFTGATAQKKGKFEVAESGTLFLDEIAELAPLLQAKLLRVLQERELEHLGGTRPIPVNVRLVAATNKDLAQAAKAGTFRTDLYYRLNVVSINMPPLRERREDIPLLADHFLGKFSAKVGRYIQGFSPEARSRLRGHDWPGNVRELQNAIEHAVVLGTSELIMPEDLPEPVLEKSGAVGLGRYHEAVAEAKRTIIMKALQQSGGNYTHAAKALGVQPTYLHRLLRNLGIK
jgi:transcriptional regulator with GAF, ATPase, and Fis domain